MNSLQDLLEESKYNITEVYKFTVKSDWYRYVAYYPYNRIYYVTDGYATLKLKDIEIHLQKGKLYFIPAFCVVSSVCEESMTHFYLHFQTDSVINNIFEYYKPNDEIDSQGDEQALIELIYDNYKGETPYAKLTTNGAFKILFARFFKDCTFQNSNIFKFSEVLTYINSHIDEPIKVPELASIMNLDKVYFISLFKKTFGIPPVQYVLSKKLHYSQILLAQNNLSIKEIAFKLGFENEVYFYRLFKHKCGVSPSEYKKNAVKTNEFKNKNW